MKDRQPINYKKYTLLLLLTAVGALIVCAAALGIKQAALAAKPEPQAVVTPHYTPKQAASQETPAPRSPSVSPSPQPAGESGAGYVVALRDGAIGVYPAAGGPPVLTSDAQAYLLPQGDLDLLKKGIPAESLSEARAILEDYE